MVEDVEKKIAEMIAAWQEAESSGRKKLWKALGLARRINRTYQIGRKKITQAIAESTQYKESYIRSSLGAFDYLIDAGYRDDFIPIAMPDMLAFRKAHKKTAKAGMYGELGKCHQHLMQNDFNGAYRIVKAFDAREEKSQISIAFDVLPNEKAIWRNLDKDKKKNIKTELLENLLVLLSEEEEKKKQVA